MFFGLSSGKGFNSFSEELNVRRGYLLDREGEPLIINKENFKAYLLLKGKSLIGTDWPKEIKPYIKNPLDLPEKGLYLLSENLTLDEVKKLKKVENVIIKGELERKLLFEGLRPLIGEVAEGEGISGLEKIFDPYLKRGDSILTSIDTKIQKKVYCLNINYQRFRIEGLAVFKLSTGELLAYYSQGGRNWLEKRIALSTRDFQSKVDKVTWELGSLAIKEDRATMEITPLHIIKALMTEACGKPLDPTILPKKGEACIPSEREMDALYLLKDLEEWFYFTRKGDILYAFYGNFSLNEKEYTPETLKNNLKYLVRNL
ncbi:MAG: hypothetical protein ACP5KO_00160 [Caldimicrobium sp.]